MKTARTAEGLWSEDGSANPPACVPDAALALVDGVISGSWPKLRSALAKSDPDDEVWALAYLLKMVDEGEIYSDAAVRRKKAMRRATKALEERWGGNGNGNGALP